MKISLCIAIVLSSGLSAYSSPFTVNCTNGAINAVDTVAVVGCLLPGGGSYTGNVTVTETPTQVLLNMSSGSFTGANNGSAAIVSAPYFLMGEGTETASLNGMLAGAPGTLSSGAEFFDVSVEGTSFTNNPANAFWTGPGVNVALPLAVLAGPNTVQGDFQGSGTALLFVMYNTGAGTAYTFSNSVDGALQTPEPGTFVVVIPLLALALRRYRGLL